MAWGNPTVEEKQPNTIHRWAGTDTTAISETTTPLTRPAIFASLTLHLSAAPTTAGNFVVTLDSANGAAYDTVLYSLDLASSSVTDLLLDKSDIDTPLMPGDAIRVTYANADARTYGLQVSLEE